MTVQCKNNAVLVKLTVNKCVHVFALIKLEYVTGNDKLKSKMKRFSGQLSFSGSREHMALMRPNKVETAVHDWILAFRLDSTSRLSLVTFHGIGLT